MRKCCICRKKVGRGIGPFFNIPNDERRRSKWTEICGIEFSPHACICGDHFNASDLIRGAKRDTLMPNAVPHLPKTWKFDLMSADLIRGAQRNKKKKTKPVMWNICRVCLQEENKQNSPPANGQMQLLFCGADNKLSKHIFDCSGVVIKANDGLPEKICQKCIKLLNYAIYFRKTCRKSATKLLSVIQRTKAASATMKKEGSTDILKDTSANGSSGYVDEGLISNSNFQDGKEEEEPDDPLHYDIYDAEEGLTSNSSFHDSNQEDEYQKSENNSINHKPKGSQQQLQTKYLVQEKNPPPLKYENDNDFIKDISIAHDNADGIEIPNVLANMEQDLSQSFTVVDWDICNASQHANEEPEPAEEDYMSDYVDFMPLEGDSNMQQIEDVDELDDNESHVASMVVNKLEIVLDDINSNLSDITQNIATESIVDEITNNALLYSGLCLNTKNQRNLQKISGNLKEQQLKQEASVGHRSDGNPATTNSKSQNCVCDVCGHNLNSHQLMNIHMKIHSQEKTKTFGIHNNKKQKNQPFACEHCGKTFTLAANLQAHLRVHNGMKSSYRCEPCAKYFKLEHNLEAHLKSSLHKSVVQLALQSQFMDL